jgi:purine-binding chemotaxis protein CheW
MVPREETLPQAMVSSAGEIGSDMAVNSARIHFVSIALGNDQYGVDIMAVREIKGWSDITHLPKQPDYVRGVLNLRGAIVPIVDLRCRFDQGRTETTPLHIIIIVQIEGQQIGLIGDRVLDIVPVDAAQIQRVPRTEGEHQTTFLSGLVTQEACMIALIALHHLLTFSTSDFVN